MTCISISWQTGILQLTYDIVDDEQKNLCFADIFFSLSLIFVSFFLATRKRNQKFVFQYCDYGMFIAFYDIYIFLVDFYGDFGFL